MKPRNSLSYKHHQPNILFSLSHSTSKSTQQLTTQISLTKTASPSSSCHPLFHVIFLLTSPSSSHHNVAVGMALSSHRHRLPPCCLGSIHHSTKPKPTVPPSSPNGSVALARSISFHCVLTFFPIATMNAVRHH